MQDRKRSRNEREIWAKKEKKCYLVGKEKMEEEEEKEKEDDAERKRKMRMMRECRIK